MNTKQKIYAEVRKLNEIINTPARVFEEKRIEQARSILDADILPSEIKTGIDYKALAIKLSAQNLVDLTDDLIYNK